MMTSGRWTCAAALVMSLAVTSATGASFAASPARSIAKPMHGAVAGDPILVAKQISLGTLGGKESEARAVSRGVIVGSAETATRRWHAFAYDLNKPHPQMLDLGTLGGGRSEATDISGSLVVGTSEADGRPGHLFVYDLAADDPKMIDLDVGRVVQSGPMVDGDLVTWAMRGPSGSGHAFAYDLGAPDPHPVDLGALDGGHSDPFDVRAGVIVGLSSSGWDTRAFAYDLNAPDPHMVDVDRVHSWSAARAIDGNLVVGDVALHNRDGAFVADLSSAEPVMTVLPPLEPGSEWATAADVDGTVVVGSADLRNSHSRPFAYDVGGMRRPINLGTLGGTATDGRATSVDAPYVVGDSSAADDRDHAFAYDLGAETPRMTDLGPSGRGASSVRAIDGNVLVGVTFPARGGRMRAMAWRLRRSTGPVLELERTAFAASENQRFARVVVRLRGNVVRPARVHYRAADPHMSGFDAREGQDFKPVAGVLRFLPGQTAKIVKVPIVDDTAPERPERFAVYLSRPVHAALGTPQVARVVIGASDVRPDAMVASAKDRLLVGDNVFNATGAGQTVRVEREPGGSAAFSARVCLDPDSPHAGGFLQRVTLYANQDQGPSHVRYFRSDGTEVTSQLRRREGLAVPVRLHHCREFGVRGHIAGTQRPGSRVAAVLTARWVGDHRHVDRVRGVVVVVPQADKQGSARR